jgi:hypothetical protein
VHRAGQERYRGKLAGFAGGILRYAAPGLKPGCTIVIWTR